MSSLKIHYEVETEHGIVVVDSKNPVLHEFSDHGEVWSEQMKLIDVFYTASLPFTAMSDDLGVTQWRYCRPIAPKQKRPMNIDELTEIAANGAIFVRKYGNEVSFPSINTQGKSTYIYGTALDGYHGYRLPHTTQIFPLEVDV